MITAIVPVYNGEKYLKEALDSIYAQTYPDIEVIVVDDGSTDGSAAVARSYPNLIYLYQENKGNALARMKGVEHATGKYIAFLDQDDTWVANKIELQMEAFAQGAEVVIGKSHYFIEGNNPPPPGLKESILKEDRTSYLPGIFMAKKEILKKIPFSPSYSHGSDTDWFFRLKEAHIPVTILPDVLLNVRLHAENLSHHTTKLYGDLLKVIKNSMDRKKPSAPLISVIIPVYNGEKYLQAALESIFAQAYRPLEVIVVDDGSTDSTRQVALTYGEKIRYVYKENGGIANARNMGIEMARGEYLSFLDSDDLWSTTKLADQLPLLTNADMIFGKMTHFYSNVDTEKYTAPAGAEAAYVAGALLIKRETFLQVGLFNPEYQVGEFIDWMVRAKDKGLSSHLLDKNVLDRRIHGENTTLKKKVNHLDYLKILRSRIRNDILAQ